LGNWNIESKWNICFYPDYINMPRKKTKQKNLKGSNGIVKITNLASKSFLSNAFSN